MKIALEVRNKSKIINPQVGNVIAFDGKEWYVTTKKDLLEDALKLVEKANADLEKIKAQNEEFQRSVSEQLYTMAEIMKKMQSGN